MQIKDIKNTSKIIIFPVLITGFLIWFIAINLISKQEVIYNKASDISCPLNGASCSWDKQSSNVKYYVEIKDLNTNTVIAKGTTANNSVKFSVVFGHKYRCTVTPSNFCGSGPTSYTNGICNNKAQISITPSPTLYTQPSVTNVRSTIPVGGPQNNPSATITEENINIFPTVTPISQISGINVKINGHLSPTNKIGSVANNNSSESGNEKESSGDEVRKKSLEKGIKTGSVIISILMFAVFAITIIYFLFKKLRKK